MHPSRMSHELLINSEISLQHKLFASKANSQTSKLIDKKTKNLEFMPKYSTTLKIKCCQSTCTDRYYDGVHVLRFALLNNTITLAFDCIIEESTDVSIFFLLFRHHI